MLVRPVLLIFRLISHILLSSKYEINWYNSQLNLNISFVQALISLYDPPTSIYLEKVLIVINWHKTEVAIRSIVSSKKISNDQELIQSDPTSCPQNQDFQLFQNWNHFSQSQCIGKWKFKLSFIGWRRWLQDGWLDKTFLFERKLYFQWR